MNPSHRHKKPSSGSPNWRGQQDIAPRDPRLERSGSDTTINQPRHTYMHHNHPHTMNPSHRHKKPRSNYPNQQGQSDIASWEPRRNSSGSDAKLNDRRDSYGSDNNGHYREGFVHHSHSSRKRRHRQYHDSCQPGDMNNEDTVEASWSVGNITTTPSAPGDWHIMKQWIILSTVRIGDIILVQA